MSGTLKIIFCRLLPAFFLLGCFGCAGVPPRFYTPQQDSIDTSLVLNPEFNVKNYVDLINAQYNSDDIFIGEYTHEWSANLRLWTDTAVRSLKTELEKRGKTVTIESPTVFELSVENVKTSGKIIGFIKTDLKQSGCPLDTDHDGVPDYRDLCPGTPAGALVDVKGCPLDSDRDGVPDYLDKCPGKKIEDVKKEQGKAKKEKPQDVKKYLRLKKYDPIAKDDLSVQGFSIVSKLPPDEVIRLIRAEFKKHSVLVTENSANIYQFIMAEEKWNNSFATLKHDLDQKDIDLIDGHPQIIWLSVNHVSLFWPFWNVGCRLNLNVRIADEYMRNFQVEKISKDLYTSCDGALSDAMAKMFMPRKFTRDTDGDGVPDYKDECPNTPKGVAVDDKGCPIDTDGDGVPDYKDECPNTPEGVTVDEKGCPPDSDRDGVPDYMDECPDTPNGVKVDDIGCPLDSDGDGVPDYKDMCPNTPPGVMVDERGCPPDSDYDGVPDDRDQCPHTPRGAKVDERGCWIVSDTLFSFNKSNVNPKYNHLLDEIVTVLGKNPSLKIEIQGHTDNIGSNSYNAKLSEKRAIAVKNYLTKKGINPKRIFPVGYGSLRPIATNKTKEGRELNRRVELVPISR